MLKFSDINDFLMDYNELLIGNYPIHSQAPGCPKNLVCSYSGPGWVETENITSKGMIYVLICRSGYSMYGIPVAQVTLVDFYGHLYVKENFQLEEQYLELGSDDDGSDATLSEDQLFQIQQELLKVISTKDIIVGFALDRAFKNLKMKHPKIINIAHLYYVFFMDDSKTESQYLLLLAEMFIPHGYKSFLTGSLSDFKEDSKICWMLLVLKLLSRNKCLKALEYQKQGKS